MTATMRTVRAASAWRIALVTALAVALSLAAAPAMAPAAKRSPRLSALPAFGSCTSLLSYARRNARRTGGQTGVPTRAAAFVPQVLSAPGAVESAPLPAAAPTQSDAKSAPSFSATNVQEVGVDEPDIVKTDGRRVFAVAGAKIHALDVSGEQPKLVGTLSLDGAHAHQLLLRGDRLLVMSISHGGGVFASDIAFSASQLVLTEVDVRDAAAMSVRRTMTLAGALVDARMTGGSARVVVGASPSNLRPAAIKRAPVRRWVPRTTLRSRVSGKTFRRAVVACDDVRHPRDFSGLDLLTVLTIDLDKGLFDVDRDAIMAGAQTVYASTTGLYVASQKYVPTLEEGRAVPARSRTQIHRFEASKDGETAYASSGEVSGFVLNRYSLSEFDGALRVASTEEPQWFAGARTQGESESFVTVLAERGSVLRPLGRVGGLGKGERIYAVRFAGDKGYVVTFRQVDPLYTLDLSEKSAPKVLGELKILGYSAYLHPISDKLLLGVGQDASAQGRTLGTQLSLFDVSDLRGRPPRAGVARRRLVVDGGVRPARIPVLGSVEPRRHPAADLRADGTDVRRGGRLSHRRIEHRRGRVHQASPPEHVRAADRPLPRHRRQALHALPRGVGGQQARHDGAAVVHAVPVARVALRGGPGARTLRGVPGLSLSRRRTWNTPRRRTCRVDAPPCRCAAHPGHRSRQCREGARRP